MKIIKNVLLIAVVITVAIVLAKHFAPEQFETAIDATANFLKG